MNALLNYLVEANLGLCLFLLLYELLLRRETDFSFKRRALLLSIGVSIIFPLFHFSQSASFIPSLGNIVPPTWLPEMVVYANGVGSQNVTHLNLDAWIRIDYVYASGVILSLTIFLTRLTRLFRTLLTSPSVRMDDCIIVESDSKQSAFSFFRFIYIGQASELSTKEKALIIQHERIHARQLHSFDVLLINAIGVFFWFNPVIRIYKKILVHLHEFEADARAVENQDVDNYCGLLAKVALLSADLKLANHFSNSLTVKRIEMIRTLKAKIKGWKIAALAVTLPCFFFVVSCQDQVMNDITDIARNSTNALLAPEVVQSRFEAVKKANPNSTYVLLELNEKGEKQLEELDKAHGIPKSIELFTPDAGKYKNSTLNTEPEKISIHQSAEWERASKESDGLRTFAIIEYNDMAAQISERAKDEDEIFSVVEEGAEFPGGIDALRTYLQSNVSYPSIARQQGIEGAVFVAFVVEKDGSISDVNVVKGVSPECDAESKRVVSGFPKWQPGKQKGEIVRSRFVIPIKFALNKTPANPTTNR
ncbi:MAG TPA: M56 family metallopeptidase [Chryseolinea sp.]|nr:M56 family metallopeptidase [Chryseolinea sp.]